MLSLRNGLPYLQEAHGTQRETWYLHSEVRREPLSEDLEHRVLLGKKVLVLGQKGILSLF